ncbi:MAG: EthD domain-containing protein [Xanthobacteraceae bacterium]|nr:EthD domain-containing protein [Xanthobacteraceae bacterium]
MKLVKNLLAPGTSTLAASMLLAGAVASAEDFKARDAGAPLMTAGLLDRKASVSPELFTRYWRDVHGPLAARINGFEQYWQHHLGAPLKDYWPIRAVEQSVPERLQIEGFAETTFRSADDRARLGGDSAAKALFVDEQNVFQATYLCPSATGDTRTLVDRLPDGAPEGRVEVDKVIVLVRPIKGSDTTSVRGYIADRLGPALAADPQTLKLRLHLLQPYDAAAWTTPGVHHDLAPDERYGAILEIAFADRATRKRVLGSAAVQTVMADAPRVIGALHTYPEVATYTMVYEGRPTLVGLKGLDAAKTILAIGARNQADAATLRIVNGADIAPTALAWPAAQQKGARR